jgi:hypothetical protein
MSENKTTIIVKKTTRELLKQIGKKEQTYNDLINELIEYRTSKRNSNDNEINGK